MITYKTAETKEERINFCKIAISNRLFINGWQLRSHLASIVNGYTDPVEIEVSLAFDDEKPIAIAFKSNRVVQCFVRSTYREKGIGTNLVSLHKCPKTYARLGNDASVKFWAKNKIICSNY